MSEHNCVIVIGMHRSGTSIVSKILSQIGYQMGDSFHEKQSNNPDGFYEDLEFVEINEQTLQNLGATWDTPQLITWENFDEELLIENYKVYVEKKGHMLWGVKDPRVCLFLDQLHRTLKNPLYVVCERHEDGVAASLLVRNGMAKQEAIELKNYYDTKITSFVNTNELSVIKIDYDMLKNSPKSTLNELFDLLKVNEPERTRLASLVSPEFKLQKKKQKQLVTDILASIRNWLLNPRYIKPSRIKEKINRWFREIRVLYFK